MNKRKPVYVLKIIQFKYKLYTKIPRVYCLGHTPIGEEDNFTCLLVDNIRTDPISQAHYMLGYPSAERTRHICKCHDVN